MPQARQTIAWWLLAALAAGLAVRLAAAVPQANRFSNSGDFATIYAAARVWSRGGDPYDQRQVDRAWAGAGGGVGPASPSARSTPSVYPPGTLMLIAPLATTLQWPAARAAWSGVSGLSLAAIVLVLPGLAGRRWSDPWAMALVAAAMAQASLRVAVLIGQPAVATTALIVLAARAAGAGRDAWAGAALAVAMSLKPQLAGGFVGYYLLGRRWRLAGIALAVPALANAAAGGFLSAHGLPWAHAMVANLHAAAEAGGVNDPSRHSAKRFELVNLHVVLYSIVDSSRLVAAMAVAVLTASGGAFVAVVLRHRSEATDPAGTRAGLPGRGLAELAFVAAWSLLAVYHRSYDGGPLVLALAWAAAAGRASLWGWAVAATTIPFVYNVAMRFGPRFASGSTAAPHAPLRTLMELLVLPVQCWALMLLGGILLLLLWRSPAANER